MTGMTVLPEIRKTVTNLQVWQYATYQTTKPQDALKEFLEAWGSEGWELVNVVYTHVDEGFLGGEGMTTMFYFKRPGN